MKTFFFPTLLATIVCLNSYSQALQFTRTGRIEFHAGTTLEDIDATNNEVASLLNPKTGEIAFTVLIKSFHFRRALMEEHFNENYMESTTFPKAVFSGTVSGSASWPNINDGEYEVKAIGNLTIHGITQKVEIPARLRIQNQKISATASFKVSVKDYEIKIPGIVADKISPTVEIKVECHYEPRS